MGVTLLDYPTRLANARESAAAFLDYAVGFGLGVRLNDPVYVEITERRDPGPGYSSCGDLAHALVAHVLGPERSALVKWLNRGANYRQGMNVGRLTRRPIGGGASGLARSMREGEQLQTGDIAVMWARPDTTDAHVFVVDTHGPDAITSWDYGQGSMRKAAWAARPDQIEGCKRTRAIVRYETDNGVRVPVLAGEPPKAIRSVIPFADLFAYAESLTP